MIEKLKIFEQYQLKNWYRLKENEQNDFLISFAKYADNNPEIIQAYFSQPIAQIHYSIEIVHQALSMYSNQWNEFLLAEIQKTLHQYISGRIEYEHISYITSIDSDYLIKNNPIYHVKIIDTIVDSLDLQVSDEINLDLLDIFTFFLLDSDKNDSKYKNWERRLIKFSTKSSSKIKEEIESIFQEDLEIEESVKSKLISLLLTLLIAIDLIPLAYYEDTFIHWQVLLFIFLGTGAIGFYFFHKKLIPYTPNTSSRIAYSITIFGGFFCSLLLLSNYYFPNSSTTKIKLDINEVHFYKTENEPYNFTMTHNGFEKKVRFFQKNMKGLKQINYLEIDIAKGFWGYDVIVEIKSK